MSKEQINITDTVMGRIHDDKIKMRPKIYFITASILTFSGLVASIITSVFLIGLIRFSLRAHGPMGEYRIEYALSSFPLWVPLLAILGLVVGVWLFRRYDFTYKINYKLIIACFVGAVITAGWAVDIMGINDALLKRGPMRGMMEQYLEQGNVMQGQFPMQNRHMKQNIKESNTTYRN